MSRSSRLTRPMLAASAGRCPQYHRRIPRHRRRALRQCRPLWLTRPVNQASGSFSTGATDGADQAGTRQGTGTRPSRSVVTRSQSGCIGGILHPFRTCEGEAHPAGLDAWAASGGRHPGGMRPVAGSHPKPGGGCESGSACFAGVTNLPLMNARYRSYQSWVASIPDLSR